MNFRFFYPIAIFLLFSGLIIAQNNPNEPARSGALECLAPFYHGVASGDPLSDRVILWTRVTTDSNSVNVDWRIATDTSMANIVGSGSTTTDATKDFSVKIDASGLQPFTWYYYEFEAYGKKSIRGRTRTLPVGDVDSLRFAVVSCADYTNGYYNAYSKITERNDLFAVIHLGDYIYEYGGGTAPRNHEPSNEILTVSDYRIRHSHYKLDEDLMRLHQQYPFFAVWDDHETANNAWFGGAENHTPGTEGNWFDRKAAGVQAYYEWMPLRMPDLQDTQRIYRKFRFGELIDLYMMDTRLQGREEQNGHDLSTSRTLLGQQQFDWFVNSMDTSSTRWQVMGQQVMMGRLNLQPLSFLPPFYPNDDQWDGYPYERQRIWDTVLTNNIQNFVVLTGDIHTSWAMDLPANNYNSSTGAGSAGVEFVATSITSSGSPLPISLSIIQSANPHIKYADLTNHGYVLLDINKNRTQGEFWFVNSISSRGTTESFNRGYFVNNGERYLRQAPGMSMPSSNMIGTKSPLFPRGVNPASCFPTSIEANLNNRESVLLGVYPNPFNAEIMIQLTLHDNAKTTATVYDLMGREVARKDFGQLDAGIYELPFNLDNLGSGAYIVQLRMGNKINQRKIIKAN
jgi:alkaline phosphatase D